MALRLGSRLAAALIALGMAASAHAAVTITVLHNEGNKAVTNYVPLSITNTTIPTPYTGPTGVVATPVTLPYTLSPLFNANANNAGGGMTTQTDGKLDLLLTFTTPTQLTLTINEGGSLSKIGNGTVNVFAGVVISDADSPVPTETFGGTLINNIGAATWSANAIFTSLAAHTSYHVSIDNALLAESFGPPNGSMAQIQKNTFSIDINQGGAPIPEPASIGILGLGTAALLARRKKERAA